ncbi:MAG TPA: MarR family transcriptional regulator [Chloroflexota bacterium]|jgi:DNA-binding MarR family transcriptional regulator
MATSPPARPGQDLCVLLAQASHALTLELTDALTAVGISPRAHCVLTHALTGGLTQSELAELCDLDKTTMVVTVDELERDGLAERRPSAADRRARIIAVTTAGRKVVEEGQEIVARVRDDVLAALPPGQREAFVDGLARLVGGRLSAPQQCQRTVRRRRLPGSRSSRNI